MIWINYAAINRFVIGLIIALALMAMVFGLKIVLAALATIACVVAILLGCIWYNEGKVDLR